MKETSEKLNDILRIVIDYDETLYQSVIAERRDFDVMYHLSPARANLVSWLPIEKSHKVLDVGAECGALTGSLAELAKEVTALEESKIKSRINESRNRKRENIRYVRTLTGEKEQDYDWIILTGKNLHLLETLLPYLSVNGRLVVAVSNCFGVRRWAGAPDEAEDVTKKEVMERLLAAGFEETKTYYPYPDYEFPMMIYSEDFLPKAGELRHNRRNFKNARYEFFSEREAFDKVIDRGMFDAYANAYLIVAGKMQEGQRCIYTKYSDERSRRFMVRTDIKVDENGKRSVDKLALTPEGAPHLVHIWNCYEKLEKRYAGSDLRVNQCSKKENSAGIQGLELEYLDGELLGDAVRRAHLEPGKDPEELLKRYRQLVYDSYDLEMFRMSEGFREVFGDREVPMHQLAASGVNVDMIFSNIIIQGDVWNLIDYEWTFDFPIPINFLFYRAYFYEGLEQPDNPAVGLKRLRELNIVSEFQEDLYREMEESFQAYILGGTTPTRDMQQLIGNPVKDVPYMEAEVKRLTKEWQHVHDELIRCDAELSAIKASRTWKLHEMLLGRKE